MAIRGPMNQVRKNCINAAFDSIDRDGNGALEFSDISQVFSGDRHPEVIAGRMTSQQVVGEWLETFEAQHNASTGQKADQRVTREEFMEYYANVSCSIDRDDYFVQMMNSSWNMDGARKTRNTWTPKGAEIGGVTGGDYNKEIRAHRRMQTKSRSPSPVMRGQRTGGDYKKEMLNPTMMTTKSRFGSTTSKDINRVGDRYEAVVGDLPKNNTNNTPAAKSDQEVIDQFRAQLVKRGTRGITGIGRAFRIADDDRSGHLSNTECMKAFHDFRINLSDAQNQRLFNLLDTDNNGMVNYEEFLRGIRGEMN